MSNADLDVEMMAMINNDDDDSESSSSSESDSNSDSDDSDSENSDGGDDGSANDHSVKGEERGGRSVDEVVFTMHGSNGGTWTDLARGDSKDSAAADDSGEIDVEKARASITANTTAAAAVSDINDAAFTDADGIAEVAGNDCDEDSDGPLHRLRRARAGLLEGYRRTRQIFVFPKAHHGLPSPSLSPLSPTTHQVEAVVYPTL